MTDIQPSVRYVDERGRVWTATAVACFRSEPSIVSGIDAQIGGRPGRVREAVLIRFSDDDEERFARSRSAHWQSPGQLRRLFASAWQTDSVSAA
jgi:hypothetical protein